MTTTTPGRRLHAALLAHGIERDDWGDLTRAKRLAYEMAEREYDGEPEAGMTEQSLAFAGTRLYQAWRRASGSGVSRPDWGDPAFAGSGRAMVACELGIRDDVTAEIELRDRLDALTAEVAAMRRDRDADLYAGEEVGNRLSRCEAAVTEVVANVGAIVPHIEDRVNAIHGRVGDRLARCEGRDGEIIERLGKLEREIERNERHQGYWNKGAEMRLAALEARAIDGGDPLRRTG